MKVKIEGEVISTGESEFDGKKYPYFEILQRSEGFTASEVIRISGNGFEVGKKVSVDCLLRLNDKGDIKLKKIETTKPERKPL